MSSLFQRLFIKTKNFFTKFIRNKFIKQPGENKFTRKLKKIFRTKNGKFLLALLALLGIMGSGLLGYQIGFNYNSDQKLAEASNLVTTTGYGNFGYGGTCIGQNQCPSSATIKYYDTNNATLARPDDRTNYKLTNFTIRLSLENLNIADKAITTGNGFDNTDYKCDFFVKQTSSTSWTKVTSSQIVYETGNTNPGCRYDLTQSALTTIIGNNNLNFDVRSTVQGFDTNNNPITNDVYNFTDSYPLKINGLAF